MDSSCEWSDNKYEPGLFTFYMQEDSLCPINKNRGLSKGHADINTRKFRSESKMPAKYRINHKYNVFNNTIAHNLSSKKSIKSLKIQSSPRIDVHEPKTQRLSIKNALKEKLVTTARENSKQTIKSTNINRYFCYDFDKQRSKMFIYKGQPSTFVKRLSKKFHKNPEIERHSTNNHNRWIKTEYTLAEQSINSDEKSLPKSHNRLNFLQFLIQRNKQIRITKSNSNKKTIETTLSKLTQFNHPKMLEIPHKMTIQQ